MALEMVRDVEVEKAIMKVLEDQSDEVWNISKLHRELQKTMRCSRRKVEISVGVLQEKGSVMVRELKPSWIIDLAPSS